MNKKILITVPDHDTTTQYFAAWVKISFANVPAKVITLAGVQATKALFEESVTAHAPHGIYLHGHGSATSVKGIDDSDLLTQGDNEMLCKGAVIHALACESGKSLGKTLIEAGARTFVGYIDEYRFGHAPSFKQRSDKEADGTAAIFLNPAFSIPQKISEGISAEEAVAFGKREYAKAYLECIRQQKFKSASIVKHNYDALVIHGDPNATL